MSIITDIRQDLQELPVTRSKIAWFVGLLVVILALVDWRWYHGVGIRSDLSLLLASGLVAAYALRWQILVPLYRAWMGFAMVLGWFVMRGLLIITFFVVVTPLGLLMRLFGKDPLDRMIDREAQTYWQKAEPLHDAARYKKRF